MAPNFPMADQNKIAKTLSAEELARFCERLAKTRGVTLQTIAHLFEEETGEKVSLMGATAFRDSTYARHLQAIKSAGELHQQMTALASDGVGVGAAAEMIVNQKLIDQLIEFDSAATVAEDGGIEALNTLSKITKRLTDSERGSRALHTRIRAMEHALAMAEEDAAKKVLRDPKLLAAVSAIRANNSLDEAAKIAAVRKKLWGERPADFTPVTTKGGIAEP